MCNSVWSGSWNRIFHIGMVCIQLLPRSSKLDTPPWVWWSKDAPIWPSTASEGVQILYIYIRWHRDHFAVVEAHDPPGMVPMMKSTNLGLEGSSQAILWCWKSWYKIYIGQNGPYAILSVGEWHRDHFAVVEAHDPPGMVRATAMSVDDAASTMVEKEKRN
jgi:hypothetical protein